MKKTWIMVVVALMMLALAGNFAMAEGTLRVGMECDYMPFNWTQAEAGEHTVALSGGGYADGYDVRMAQLIADGLEMELQIVKTAWDGLPMGVMSGNFDLIIAGMSPTEERKVSIDFTEPYYTSDLVIVVKKEGAYADATSLADFAGAKITAQLNTVHYTMINQIAGVEKLTAMETFPAMSVALQAGAIDGYVSERPTAVMEQVSNPALTFVSFDEANGFDVLPEDVMISIGLVKGSALKEPINAILAEITQQQRDEIMAAVVEANPLRG